MSKGHRSQLKEHLVSKLKQFEQQNIILNYNTKYKINILESIRIQINNCIKTNKQGVLLLCRRIPNNVCRNTTLKEREDKYPTLKQSNLLLKNTIKKGGKYRVETWSTLSPAGDQG